MRACAPVDIDPRSCAVSGWCSLTYATMMSRASTLPTFLGASLRMVSPSPPLARKSVTATVKVPGAQVDWHSVAVQLFVSQSTLPVLSSTMLMTMAPGGASLRMVSPSPPLARKSVTATVKVPGAQVDWHSVAVQLFVSQSTLPVLSSTMLMTMAPGGASLMSMDCMCSQSIV